MVPAAPSAPVTKIEHRLLKLSYIATSGELIIATTTTITVQS